VSYKAENVNEFLQVSKPLRYVDHEINRMYKNIEGLLSICLIYPDIYEIGMSNYGMQLIYNEINKSPYLFADRFFMPNLDALEVFGNKIFKSLEYKKLLKTFDIIGFSLQCELTLTNMLCILDKSGIGIHATKRDFLPIIVAGGSITYNPLPLIDFIDVFFIGEMEIKFKEACEKLYELNLKSKTDILHYYNSFDFCYVPAIDEGKKVKRYINMDFSNNKNTYKPLIPLYEIVHDRLTIEAVRGCLNGCRFCQAGYIYRPLREKDINILMKEAYSKIDDTGHLNCSFLSLSISDYSNLTDFIRCLREISEQSNTAFSLPSIRADLLDSNLLYNTSIIKKSSFTIAAEAGSESLRRTINKNISNENLFYLIEEAARKELDLVKIYFMIGLPGETEKDIISIAELVRELKKRGKSINHKMSFTVSVSNFVPKVFTPFQWVKQADKEELMEKQNYLRQALKKIGVNVRFHNIKQSIIEGVISRGDRDIGKIIENAYRNGCILDEWKEHFDFNKWLSAFDKQHVNYEECLKKSYDINSKLPWDFIDTGVSKDFLANEYRKSVQSLNTPNCARANCNSCGVCDFRNVKNVFSGKYEKNLYVLNKQKSDGKYVYKINFKKADVALLLSALDVTRLFAILLRSFGVKLMFSNGFHKQPKINYIFPLPLGIWGENELLIIEVNSILNTEDLKQQFNSNVYCGLAINEITLINAFKLNSAIAVYRFDENLFLYFTKLLDLKCNFYEKINKRGEKKIVNINDYIVKYRDNRVEVKVNNNGTINFIDFFKYWNYYNDNSLITRELIKIN
jgi:radical SAM family uncharacterized protein/radical SAM-linked protein